MTFAQRMVRALALADRRDQLTRHAPVCPKCRSRQVQLRNWIDGRLAHWRCRDCQHPFRYEPIVAIGACRRSPALAKLRAAIDQLHSLDQRVVDMWGDDMAAIPAELYQFRLYVAEATHNAREACLGDVAAMLAVVD